MSWNIIPFRGKQEASLSIPSTQFTANSEKVHAIMALRWSSLVDVNRFEKEKDTNARHFFDTLRNTQTLFIIQTHGKKIVPEDTVYVLTDPDIDKLREWNTQYTIDVWTFLRYINKEQESPMDAIMDFTCKHNIRIEYGEENEDIIPHVHNISDILDFSPEDICIASNHESLWYEYNIHDERGELWISAKNFDLSKEEIPSLLFLMIETVQVLWLGSSDTDTLQIIRYWDNEKIPRLVIHASYSEFIEEIDRWIERAYPHIYKIHRTPEERRRYVYEKILKHKLDPNHIGGKLWETMDDEAE